MIHWEGGQIWRYARSIRDEVIADKYVEHYLFVDSRPSPTSNYGNDVHIINIIVLETGEVDSLIVRESNFLRLYERVDDEPTLPSR